MSSKRDRARSCMHSSFRWLKYYKHGRINLALVTVFKPSSNVSSRLAACVFLSLSLSRTAAVLDTGLRKEACIFGAFTVSGVHVSRRSGGWQLWSAQRVRRGCESSSSLWFTNKLFFWAGSFEWFGLTDSGRLVERTLHRWRRHARKTRLKKTLGNIKLEDANST